MPGDFPTNPDDAGELTLGFFAQRPSSILGQTLSNLGQGSCTAFPVVHTIGLSIVAIRRQRRNDPARWS
jgi:hypothetical protein